jgi:hypothetical protein
MALPLQTGAEAAGAFTITADSGEAPVDGTDYTQSENVLTIISGKAMTISMADSKSNTTDTIVIDSVDPGLLWQ